MPKSYSPEFRRRVIELCWAGGHKLKTIRARSTADAKECKARRRWDALHRLLGHPLRDTSSGPSDSLAGQGQDSSARPCVRKWHDLVATS